MLYKPEKLDEENGRNLYRIFFMEYVALTHALPLTSFTAYPAANAINSISVRLADISLTNLSNIFVWQETTMLTSLSHDISIALIILFRT